MIKCSGLDCPSVTLERTRNKRCFIFSYLFLHLLFSKVSNNSSTGAVCLRVLFCKRSLCLQMLRYSSAVILFLLFSNCWNWLFLFLIIYLFICYLSSLHFGDILWIDEWVGGFNVGLELQICLLPTDWNTSQNMV